MCVRRRHAYDDDDDDENDAAAHANRRTHTGMRGGCSVFQLRVRNGKKDCDVSTSRVRALVRDHGEKRDPLVYLTVRDPSNQGVVDRRHQV